MRLSSLLRAFALAFFASLFLVVLAPGCGRSSLELESFDASTSEAGTCGPSSCPTGCCDRKGTCRVGSDTQACGSKGAACSDCIANGFTTCDVTKGRVCARESENCGPTDCPSGCCSFDSGQGKCLAGSDPTACGAGGATCTDCSQDGRACDSLSRSCTTTKCDSTNCKGCCVGDQCLGGLDNTACGTLGASCTSCTQTGQTCGAAMNGGGGMCEGTAACGPANCGGCCNGTTCVVGTDASACGKQGASCANCSATGRTCVADGQPNERTCQTPPACSPANCAGCCQGNACVVATTRAACGKGGAACIACGANDSCNAGVCVPPVACNAASCPGGCCVGDVCAAGTQDTSCGKAGAACTNCAAAAQVCQAGTCAAPVCSPANCAGCCSGNTCVTGVQDATCGKAGAACSDCTATNQACDAQACKDKCGPANCVGCCSSTTTCAGGFANAACGSGGAACANCQNAGSTCNGLTTPRICANQVGQCPATYPGCAAGAATPITASLQNVCDDVGDLDSIQAGCDGGNCAGAFSVLQATNPACAACLIPFNYPFSEGTGLYRCAAPFVDSACNHNTACASDCEDTTCDQCPAATESSCRSQVFAGGGRCNTLATSANTCISPAVAPAGLCHTDGRTFGQWLRAVGDHFCGNGP